LLREEPRDGFLPAQIKRMIRESMGRVGSHLLALL
jgi:hypothetical protein